MQGHGLCSGKAAAPESGFMHPRAVNALAREKSPIEANLSSEGGSLLARRLVFSRREPQ